MYLVRISSVESVTTTAGRSNCAASCCRTEKSRQCLFTGLHTTRSVGQRNTVEAAIETLRVSEVRIPGDTILRKGNSLRYRTSANSGQKGEEKNTVKITIKKLLMMMMMMIKV
jgi:hypothetical protein